MYQLTKKQELNILKLMKSIIRYSNKYEISIQYWPDQWAIFIAKDGIDLTSFGGEPEDTLERGLEYLNRITKNNESKLLKLN